MKTVAHQEAFEQLGEACVKPKQTKSSCELNGLPNSKAIINIDDSLTVKHFISHVCTCKDLVSVTVSKHLNHW